MTPRKMLIDFKGVPLNWARDEAFSASMNSFSPFASAFEPYLNTVMAKVRDTLPDECREVKRDIDLFIAQEGHHYRVHNGFNKELYARYPKAKEMERQLAVDLKTQLKERSLEFNLAYCAGFENLACFVAKFTFSGALPYYEGADLRMATLFLWHNAEEYEHRGACSAAMNAAGVSYLTRLRGFFAFFRHAMPLHKRIADYLLEVDRAEMTVAQRQESILCEKRYNRKFSSYVLPRVTQVLVPFYDPMKQKAPQALEDALARYTELVQSANPQIA